jgi:hypothetical protein
MKRILDRRRFLQGAGVLLSLPLFESLTTTARADVQGPPKRLVIFYCTQGHPYPAVRDPIGTPSAYQLNDVFQEPVDTATGRLVSNVASSAESVRLADFKSEMSIVTGLSMQSAIDQPGNAHNQSCGHALCATKMLPSGPSDDWTQAGGASIDHLVSQRITPASVAFGALHLSVRDPWDVCFTGPAQPVSRLTTPDEIALSLFGDFVNPDPSALVALRQKRKSVLDATKENIAHLRARLSAADRPRLDEYLERVKEIEKRLNATLAGESCQPLGAFHLERSPFREHNLARVPDFHPWYDPDIASPAVLDCLVEALACDRTRVATVTYNDNEVYHWLRDQNGATPSAGTSGNWHNDVVHAFWPGEDPTSMPVAEQKVLGDWLRRVARWELAQLAYLLYKLRSKKEGAGTLLDNTLVLYVNEFGEATHVHTNMMYLLAGGAGGALKKGQWLQAPGEPHNRLLLSVLRAFGIDDATFGDPQYCGKGPLTGLLA